MLSVTVRALQNRRRLAFKLSPSPEIFHASIHATLEGLPGVSAIADDILVYGCGETTEEAKTRPPARMEAL